MPAGAHFVEVFPSVFDAAWCDSVIARFEAEARTRPSETVAGRDPAVRSGTILLEDAMRDWGDVAGAVHAAARTCAAHYARKYPSISRLLHAPNYHLTTPLVERIAPGQGFNWHIDGGPMDTFDRFLSVIIYLADVTDGGATEFPYQAVGVRPKKGALVLFPPFWTHLHRGAPPVRETKYNITCFFVRSRTWERPPG